MSDLMGSDLPVPEKNSDGVMQASFKWCDGVLLTAIKNGDWVLLDELNLASQSVLEGLNSCLDYRASVFVPELGKTFQCPPTFRVFAAQNPMAQGGGRKGLPRSFLNRFTKCHVDSLTGYDLRAIVSSKYPLLSAELVDKMVQFNERVHSAIVVHHEFGLAGTPWEFNLRDVFRWADLLVAVNGYQSTRACSLAARDIYLQRFRTRKDRDYLQSIYSEVFGSKVIVAGPVDFMVMDQAVKVGDTVLPRLENGKVHGFDTYRKEPAVFKSLLRPMEAVARCIHMKWPCLLVGGPGSGKTAVLNGLSELCNAKLIEVALSPSSDVNELVGNFEQMDIAAKDRESLRAMEHIASMYVLKHRFSAGFNHRVCELLFTLTRVLEELSDSEQSILTRNKSLKALAEVLLEALESAAKSLPVFGTVYGKAINEAKSHIKRDSRQDADDSHFRWVDGVLAKAMTEGYWLLLENVNLCPSSVLDRLNPVMEKDGELLMAECGIQEDGNDKFSHRTITAHPNFRLFLSMDPDHGEVSRAMRNRCVEVAFLQPQPFSGTIHKDETFVDSMDVAWRAGLRSSKLANGLLKSYDMLYDNAVLSGMEPPSIKIISESAALGACLLAHGGTAKDTSRILSSVFSVNLPMYVADRASSDSASLLTVPLLRFSWLEFPQQAAVDWDSRLLRLFLGWSQQLPAAPVLMPNGDKLFDGSLAISENLVEKYEKVCPSLSGIASEALQLRDNFAALTLASSSREGLMMRLACLDGHNDDFARTYETLAKICRPIALQLLKSASLKNWEVFNLIRLPQKISERVWFERMASMNSISVVSSELTVLDVSFLMQEGRMDRSCISCQVTPVLYPLFQALDSWIAEVFDLVYNWVKDSRANDLLDLCLRCLSQKDRLWLWLRNHPFSFTDDGFLAFDEAKFIVQWKWFKKNLRLFEMSYQVHESTPMREKRSQVNILIETIDAFVFGEGGDRSGIGASIWKKVSHPLVPRKASQWLAVEQLRKLAKSYSIRDDPSLEKQDILELDDLIKAHHPALFVHNRDKAELLLALCMVHWSFTDEISGEMRARPLSFSVEDARTAIMEQWDDKRKQFMAQIEAMKIDASIDTVENQIGLDDLKQLASGAVDASKTDFTGVSDRILCNFGRLQFALCSEKWCSNREVELMRDICELVLESNDPCRLWDGLSSTIALRARDFLEAALTWTTWPVSDLRPYQTLIWACESPSFPQENAVNFIRCLMPAISSASLKHSMAISSYTPPKTISERMEMPALFDTDSSRQDPSSQLIMDHKPMKTYSSWILTDTVLGLVGGLLSTSRSSRAKKTLFATMENHRARAIQSRDFIKVLSAASVTGAPRSPFEISYFLGETLTAMPPSSLSIDLSTEDINEMVRSRDFSRAVKLAEACPHTVVQNLFKPVIVPLFDSLSVVWEGGPTLTRDCGDSLPLAFAYFGLLRFHLLMPDSPVDPGRTPLAKMEVLGAHLKDLRIQIAAIRLHSGFCHGDFSPDTDYVRKLLDDSLSLHEKRLGQEAKVVERVAQAPPFVEFFREVRDFSRNLCSKETVLDLIKVIREAAMSPSQALQAGERVDNWQRSAGAFRERLLSYFWAYEDIVVPLVDSICFLQSGLRDFLDFHLPSQTKLARHDDTLRICLRYPMGDFNGDLNEVWETMQSLSSANKAEVKTQRALGFALLSRFVLRKLMSGLDPHITQCCRSIFDSLVAKELQGNDDASKDTDSEDLQEKLFREQFPDHRSEFNALLRSDEGTEETAVGDLDDSQVSVYAEMSHEERNKLCIFHRLLFSSEVGIQDSDRIWAFRECFSAADNILSTSGSPSRTSEELVGTAGHVFALSLASSPRNACALRDVSSRLGSGANIQFYRDANPEEVIKAAPAIEHLIARITQLLTAFPGNEILLGVFKVADKVRKLDLHSAPIGKAMIGLEVILRHAQDWEQHASERARLGNALVEVSRVVAMWRKLELDSWKDLLSSREHRFLEQARRHWTRLYKMFHADQASSYGYSNVCLNSLNESSDQWSPRWVWKGLAKHARALFPSLVDTPSSELLELGKVLDTFMLTSPLGEYKERLALIKSFSEQLLHEAQGISEELRLSRMQCSRLLSSLWLYYRQYSSFISTKLETLRAPIESNLRDQMKLAKWDEQSYYALAESSEKNHRNLMKCLREYDDALDMNVGDLLERELNFGIRSESVSTQEEPSTSVPPDSLFFPMIPKGKTLSASSAPRSLNRIPSVERDWTNLSSVASDLDSYAGKIGRYASKILSMLQKQKHSGVSWSGIGKTNARDLCDSIFHRIESLRSGKASRQMKERALVDLFKTLKKNGYSNTKWSTPKESREMMQLFQLPSPAIHPCGELEAQSSILRESEDYYLRFVSELRRFRTEVDVIGSKYMTSRQTEMMLSFCEHGLLMISQQRCLISTVLLDFASLTRRVNELSFDGTKLAQSQLLTKTLLLDSKRSYLSATENIKQLFLLIKMSRPVLSQGGPSIWARETMGDLEALVSDLTRVEISSPSVVTEKETFVVRGAQKVIDQASAILQSRSKENVSSNYIPHDAFDECLVSLNEASSNLSSCLRQIESPDNHPAPPIDEKTAKSLIDAVSSAVKHTLLAVQPSQRTIETNVSPEDGTGEDKEAGMWSCHSEASREWAEMNLKNLNTALERVFELLHGVSMMYSLHSRTSKTLTSLISDLGVLCQLALAIIEKSLDEFIQFHRDSSKFHYVLIRVFRILVSKGYCSDDVSEEDGGNDGDASGMNFEDNVEGTGMGEGDGKQDVTDQLENEEQLLGLQDNKENDEQGNQQDRDQLNEEEAEQGMEMEGQFEGEMYDMPDKKEGDDDDAEDNDNEEELDREMGLDDDPNEQVVDEKMWEESDDEKEMDEGDEKFEKNSNMQGAQQKDQVRTKEDDEADNQGTEGQNEEDNAKQMPQSGEQDSGEQDEGDNRSDHDDINEDLEDNYEDNHGVDVREEPTSKEDLDDSQEQPMELDDNLQLDEENDGEKENPDDPQDELHCEEGIDQQAEEENNPMDEVDSNEEPNNESPEDDAQMPSATLDDTDMAQNEKEEDTEEEEPPKVNLPSEPEKQNEGLGVRAVDGQDACQDTGQEDESDQGEGADGQDEMETTGAQLEKDPSGMGGSGSGERGNEGALSGESGQENEALNEAPNPFKNPGDATKFWHQKLNMVETENTEDTLDTGENPSEEQQHGTGEFEYVSEEQKNSTTQVLGEVTEDQAVELEQRNADEDAMETNESKEPQKQDQEKGESKAKKSQSSRTSHQPRKADDSSEVEIEPTDDKDDNSEAMENIEEEEQSDEDSQANDGDVAIDDGEVGNRVVSDLSRLKVDEDFPDSQTRTEVSLIEDQQVAGISSAETSEARARWARIQGETYTLALRLCEKLRLVMEPLVASKLRGDYRTGKRINMKRVIGYIASGYRKDKIWLRRTKPAKRNYRVLLAVDDSESMLKCGTGEMALRAMATLAVGMSQLEIGELGVASFGDDMKLLHPFDQPFTSESGVDVVKNFKFDQPRTRTALCVESALSVLDTPGDAESVQLMFLISDGRIERDSRLALKRLIREMMERNILLAMIIVEGGDGDRKEKKNDSILNMKEVTFEKGKPKVKRFIEDYPFPFYVVIDHDVQTLPEVLGDALRQWFELQATIAE